MNAPFQINPDDLTSPDVLELLQLHLDEMYQWSPADKVHALPVEQLREPGVTFFVARDGTALAAVGALKQLDAEHGEIKAMRANPAYRGKGAGEAILLHLLGEAKARGLSMAGIGDRTHRPVWASGQFVPQTRLC